MLCGGTSPWCHPAPSRVWGRPGSQTLTPVQVGGPLHFPKEGDAVSDPWWFPGAGTAENGSEAKTGEVREIKTNTHREIETLMEMYKEMQAERHIQEMNEKGQDKGERGRQ